MVSEMSDKISCLIFQFTGESHRGINVITECMSQFLSHHVYKYKHMNGEGITC